MPDPLDETFWEAEKLSMTRAILRWLNIAALLGARRGAEPLVNVLIDWTMVNRRVMGWVENYTFELVNEITQTSREFLGDAISQWIESREPIDELIDTIEESGRFGPVRARMIAVTEVTRAYAEGNLETWRSSGVVDKKRWMTAQDELVCKICGPLANQETNLQDGFVTDEGDVLDGPPAHVNCRCSLFPVVELTEEEQQYANRHQD